jgi:hypothetical protein
MIDNLDISKEINQQIDLIKSQILSGDISLLNLELNPLFQKLEDSVSVFNLENYSDTYKNACDLLHDKFKELKELLKSFDNEKIILKFMGKNPSDSEIEKLLEGCWQSIFSIENISIDFLKYANERFSKGDDQPITVEHLKRSISNEDFFLEIPEVQFTQKLDKFYEEIKEKLPCFFEVIFEKEKEQIKIYEKFVFLLHLLQLGKIKYQNETNTLYI